MLVRLVKEQCGLGGYEDSEIIESARTGTKLPKKPKVKRPRKPGAGKPKAPKVTKVTAEVLVPLYGESEPVASNAACPNGGFLLPVGFDRNGNKKLDAEEVVGKLQSGCNGKDGAPGKPGKPGQNGANSYTTRSERFTSHADCPAGGSRSTNWTDLNGNGILDLDKDEAIGDVVVCDGQSEKPRDGLDGRPGRDGTSISFGLLFTGDLIFSSAPDIRSSAFGLMLNLQKSWAEVTVGGAWSPGIDHGTVFSADFAAYPLWNRFGPRIGAQLIYAEIDQNNQAKYQVIMVTPGIAVRLLDERHWKVRTEVHLGVGKQGTYSQFDDAYSFGASGSLMYSF